VWKTLLKWAAEKALHLSLKILTEKFGAEKPAPAIHRKPRHRKPYIQ
jgi:hypothetical protein